MDPKVYPAKDLCRIIEIASHSNVASLKFGDVEIVFKKADETQASAIAPGAFYPNQQPVSQAREQQPQVNNEIIDKELLEDMRRSQLMIDDPMSFEQEMIDLQTRTIGHETAQN